MTRIGLLSDTHGLLDKRIYQHFQEVDEIWHAGDIGSLEVLNALRSFKPTRAVFGNMDSGEVRHTLNEFYRFRVENIQVLMTHIGGYPGRYNPWLLPMFQKSLDCLTNSPTHLLQDTDTDTATPHTTPIDNIHNTNLIATQQTQPTTSPSQRIDLFVCGHSHILKVQYDSHYQFLTMNPGAAGKQGWQIVQTLLRFTIDNFQIKDMEVIEMPKK